MLPVISSGPHYNAAISAVNRYYFVWYLYSVNLVACNMQALYCLQRGYISPNLYCMAARSSPWKQLAFYPKQTGAWLLMAVKKLTLAPLQGGVDFKLFLEKFFKSVRHLGDIVYLYA